MLKTRPFAISHKYVEFPFLFWFENLKLFEPGIFEAHHIGIELEH